MTTSVQAGSVPAAAPPPAEQPLYAWVQLTNKCNLRCNYCYTESSPTADGGELDLEVARGILRDVHASGSRTVMLSGGEPTAYPGLVDLLDYGCGELELDVTLVTNGTHIKPVIVERLQRYGCTVQVSLDSVDPRGYEEARGKARLPLALKGIDRLIDAGIPVTLSAALTTVNQRWAGRIVQFAIDRGIQFVHFAPTYWKDGSGPFQQSLFIEDLYPVLRELYEIQKRQYLFVCVDLIEHLVVPVALGIQRKFYCNAMAGRTVEVASDGNVYACAAQRDVPEMKLGEISSDFNLVDIVEESRRRGGFPSLGAESVEECLSCEYRYVCAGGCRAMTVHQSGGLHMRHPNCADLKRFIGDIKGDVESGEIADYVDFLRGRMPMSDNPDGLLKLF